MIDAVEQWNDPPDSLRIFESAECCLHLRGLHGKPEHIDRRNFCGHRNLDFEVAERTLQSERMGILRERFRPNYESDRMSQVRQTSADQATNAAGSENRMFHWTRICFRHEALIRAASVLLHGRR